MAEQFTEKKTKKTSSKPKNTRTKLPRRQGDWLELCKWLELNIFGYDSKQKLQYGACLILDGLRKGQFVANNNIDTNGEYPMEVVLITFKINKDRILNAIQNKDFESEAAKMSYICAIARNYINDVYTRYTNAQKTQEKVEKIDTSIIEHQGAEYQSTIKDYKKKDKFKELW